MEVSGVVFRSMPSCFSIPDATHYSHSSSSFLPPAAGSRFSGYLRPTIIKFSNNSGFRDNGHIEYYSLTTMMIRCGTGTGTGGKKKKEKEEKEKEGCGSSTTMIMMKKKQLKKKMKLLKGLSEDLTMFSDMGFGLVPDHGLAGQVKGKMISDASELLLAQLQKLKAEERELKRKKKEEKAKLKAKRMQNNRLDCEAESSSSSSSSSESSDSECGEVIDMSCLKTESPLAQAVPKELQSAILTLQKTLPLPKEGNMIELQPAIVIREASSTTLPSVLLTQMRNDCEERGFGAHNSSQILEQECCTSCCKRSELGSDGCNEGSNLLVRGAEKKIEVCMGGKCKKSGAPLLLDEFQRMVGVEVAVVGCKCMGKCRDGPNVRVLNHLDSAQSDDSVRTPSNHPLCIGVGLEDVGLILSNFFGEAQTDLGVLAAAS